MDSKYFLLFRTAQSEFRAWENLDGNLKKKVFPIVELTRGRKKPETGKDIDVDLWPKTPGIFAFDTETNKKKIVDAFSNNSEVIIDLTREYLLSCFEINEISQSRNGYEAWTEYLGGLSEEIPNLIPTLIVNPAEDELANEFKENIIRQFDVLTAKYNKLAYRAAVLVDPDFLYDLTILKDKIAEYIEAGNHFYVELDHEYIRSGTGILHSVRTLKLVTDITNLVPGVEIIILSTSFPSVVDAQSYDSFPMEEVKLYEELIKRSPSETKLYFGDYGSVNPVRNDISGARGWVPRIDYPTDKKSIFYYREKRIKVGERNNPKTMKNSPIYSDYGPHYVNVAQQVTRDSEFKNIPVSWGVKSIVSTARGDIAGKAPSFWISVRMEIHIIQQLKRLGLAS